ncbi:hypothetical protein KA082_02745 [Candidatus Woesebacteria bacterium]|nr:hypothetical protein [Candidatus Woesebacteria bacterium]
MHKHELAPVTSDSQDSQDSQPTDSAMQYLYEKGTYFISAKEPDYKLIQSYELYIRGAKTEKNPYETIEFRSLEELQFAHAHAVLLAEKNLSSPEIYIRVLEIFALLRELSLEIVKEPL